jgi:hypothetical protein
MTTAANFSFEENGKDRYIKENTSYSILLEKEGYSGGEGPDHHRGLGREHHLREGVLPATAIVEVDDDHQTA